MRRPGKPRANWRPTVARRTQCAHRAPADIVIDERIPEQVLLAKSASRLLHSQKLQHSSNKTLHKCNATATRQPTTPSVPLAARQTTLAPSPPCPDCPTCACLLHRAHHTRRAAVRDDNFTPGTATRHRRHNPTLVIAAAARPLARIALSTTAPPPRSPAPAALQSPPPLHRTRSVAAHLLRQSSPYNRFAVAHAASPNPLATTACSSTHYLEQTIATRCYRDAAHTTPPPPHRSCFLSTPPSTTRIPHRPVACKHTPRQTGFDCVHSLAPPIGPAPDAKLETTSNKISD